MIPADKIKELRALCAAATPGPWTDAILGDLEDGSAPMPLDEIPDYVRGAIAGGPDGMYYFVWCQKPDGVADACHTGNGPTSQQNAAFIAASRTAVPLLLAAYEALREEIRAWRCEASTVHCAWTKRTKAESTKIMEQYVAECIQYHRENGCDDD